MRRTVLKSVVTLCALAGAATMQGCVVEDILAEMRATNAQLETIGTRMSEIDSNLISIDRHLSTIDAKLASVDAKLLTVDNKLGTVDAKLASIDEDLDSTNESLASLRKTINNIDKTIPFLSISGDEEEGDGKPGEAAQGAVPASGNAENPDPKGQNSEVPKRQ